MVSQLDPVIPVSPEEYSEIVIHYIIDNELTQVNTRRTHSEVSNRVPPKSHGVSKQ